MYTIKKKNINEIKKFLDSLSFIDYGVYKDGKVISGRELNSTIFSKYYKNLKPEQIIRYKCGVCWDTSHLIYLELTRCGFICKEIYLEVNCPPEMPTHSFVCVNYDELWYIVEYSWFDHRGISPPFETLEEIYNYYDIMMRNQINDKYQIHEIAFFDISGYRHPGYGLNCVNYMRLAKRKILNYNTNYLMR